MFTLETRYFLVFIALLFFCGMFPTIAGLLEYHNNKNAWLSTIGSVLVAVTCYILGMNSFIKEETTDSYVQAVEHQERLGWNAYTAKVNVEVFQQHLQDTLDVQKIDFHDDVHQIFDEAKDYTVHATTSDADGKQQDISITRDETSKLLVFEELEEKPLPENVLVEQ